MELSEYQAEARHTDRANPSASLEVHLLGLAGQAGSVVSEYKKWLRDGSAHQRWQAHMKEELGDVLWYLAAIASDLGLDLKDVATSNLTKTQSRWGTPHPELGPLDLGWPEGERLPRHGTYRFVPVTTGLDSGSQRAGIEIWFDGDQIGDRLTDASHVDDGYRFHDVFHLSYAAVLGWSPVTRKLMGRKRRSDPIVDENEDGGRAIAIEEGIGTRVRVRRPAPPSRGCLTRRSAPARQHHDARREHRGAGAPAGRLGARDPDGFLGLPLTARPRRRRSGVRCGCPQPASEPHQP